jgi:hypothetical protein
LRALVVLGARSRGDVVHRRQHRQRRVAGINGGTLTTRNNGLELDGYSIQPGYEAQRQGRGGRGGPPLEFSGTLTVEGRGVSPGKLTLDRNMLDGTFRGASG